MALLNFLRAGLLATTIIAAATAQPHLRTPRAAAAASTSASSSAGCGKAAPVKPGQWESSTTAEGREYRIFLPSTYDPSKPTPLILSYHGATHDIDQRVSEDRLSSTEFNTDHIVVYLQGVRTDPDDPTSTTWEGSPGAPADDFAFTSDVLDAVEAQFCVDTARTYATGKSQGGGFVGRLACDPKLSQRIAAFAPVAGAFYNTEITEESQCDPVTMDNPCNAGRTNIPILEMHGGNDQTIDFHGGWRKGACIPAIRHWTKDWAKRNNLDLNDVESSITGTDNGIKYVYGDGLVTLVKAGDDVGHVWMSVDKGNADVEASEWVMEFFRKHSL